MPVAQPRRLAAIQTLVVDQMTAEAVGALRGEGVEPLLLRGPAVASRLYPPSELRPYVDADLLVAPEDHERAEAVLEVLGFAPIVAERAISRHRPLHAREWVRRRDGAAIDLHRTLPGVGAAPGELWEALSEDAGRLTVGGVAAAVPSARGLALVVALHAAHHGPRKRKVDADLAAALTQLSPFEWQAAAELARRLDADGAFALGLRRTAAGAALAERLALPRQAPLEVVLHAQGAPPLAAGLDWLARTPGARAKLALLWQTAFPAPGALRQWRPLARRGRGGLVAAYATHALWLARHGVPSARALRRARRTAG